MYECVHVYVHASQTSLEDVGEARKDGADERLHILVDPCATGGRRRWWGGRRGAEKIMLRR